MEELALMHQGLLMWPFLLAGQCITMQSLVSVQSSPPVRPQSSLSARSQSSSISHIIWKKILWMCVSTLGAKRNTLHAYLIFSNFISQCQCFSNLQGGDLPNVIDISKPRLYLLQWLKSDRALMMLFNDGTFQVQIIYAWSWCGHSSLYHFLLNYSTRFLVSNC